MLLFGDMWTLGVTKAVECFKYSLIDHPRKSTEDSDAEGNLNYEGLAQEISDKKNFSMQPTDCSCDILLKIVAAFCPCPKKKICLWIN